jgi:nitrite reductase/ring-hydroxylating ferredoxin subunit
MPNTTTPTAPVLGSPMGVRPMAPPSGGSMPPPPMAGPRAGTGPAPRLLTKLAVEGADRGGWHQNWIAIALSSEVAPGAMIGRGLFGDRVMIARRDDGVAQVTTAYCRHFGADLTFGGKLTGDGCVVCPFHHWKYDLASGQGLTNGFDEPLPDRAKLFAFPTKERFGVIWAFNGPEPTHDVPGFEGFDDDDLEIAAMQIPMPRTQETWVPFSNSHDFTHLGFLHRVNYSDGPNDFFLTATGGGHRITFELPTGKRYAHIVRIAGTNSIQLDVTNVGTNNRFLNMFTAIQTDPTMTMLTTIAAAPKALGPAGVAAMMAESFEYGMYLASEDDPVIQNARFVPDVVQPRRDREIVMYIDYVKGFPRHNPFAMYPTSEA